MSASRSKDTYLAAKYRRIATRRGPVIAIVALEHVVLVSIWNMITNDRDYRDPGGDYFTRRNPDRQGQEPRNRPTPRHRLRRHLDPAATLNPAATGLFGLNGATRVEGADVG